MMNTQTTLAKNVQPHQESWNGTAVEIFKETENGIPTGKLSITWEDEHRNQTTLSYHPDERIELFT